MHLLAVFAHERHARERLPTSPAAVILLRMRDVHVVRQPANQTRAACHVDQWPACFRGTVQPSVLQAHTHTHTHTHTHKRMCTPTMHSPNCRVKTQTRTHVRGHNHTYMHAHTSARCARGHTHTHIHTHMRAHLHLHARTHTHTHTHTHSPVLHFVRLTADVALEAGRLHLALAVHRSGETRANT